MEWRHVPRRKARGGGLTRVILRILYSRSIEHESELNEPTPQPGVGQQIAARAFKQQCWGTCKRSSRAAKKVSLSSGVLASSNSGNHIEMAGMQDARVVGVAVNVEYEF